eukprot:3096291-Amphidinium_carterae.1
MAGGCKFGAWIVRLVIRGMARTVNLSVHMVVVLRGSHHTIRTRKSSKMAKPAIKTENTRAMQLLRE